LLRLVKRHRTSLGIMRHAQTWLTRPIASLSHLPSVQSPTTPMGSNSHDLSLQWNKVRAIAFGTVALALRVEPCFASPPFGLRSTIAIRIRHVPRGNARRWRRIGAVAQLMFRVLSLFAGIGGFDLGLERTGGFCTVAFCEIDPFCQRVLAKHWPEVPCYHDVRELTAERLAADGIRPNAIVGGFPCQNISQAGASWGVDTGIEGDRSSLWFEYARIIGELQPQLVVVENVAALLDRGLGDVLGALAALGYDAEWHCIPASYVGALHQRDRVWVVAYPHSQGLEGYGRPREAGGLAGRLACGAQVSAGVWAGSASSVLRMADGLSDRVDRIKSLGNAVVPQIPELIGRAILASVDTHAERRDVEQARPARVGSAVPNDSEADARKDAA
jgi:DNA (cytosine-5)-methyltransferase 1